MNHHSSYQQLPQGMYGYPSNVHHQGPAHPHHLQPHSHSHSHSHGHHSISYSPGQPHQLPLQSSHHSSHNSQSLPPHSQAHQPSLSQSLNQVPLHHTQLQAQHHAADFTPQMVPHGGQPGRPLIVSSTPGPPTVPSFVPQHQYPPHHHHHHSASAHSLRHASIPTPPPPLISQAPPPPPLASMQVPHQEPPPSMHPIPNFNTPSPSSLQQLAQEIESRFHSNLNATTPPVNPAESFLPPPDSPYTPKPQHIPFKPPLPWLSAPGEFFPPRLPRKKKIATTTIAKELSTLSLGPAAESTDPANAMATAEEQPSDAALVEYKATGDAVLQAPTLPVFSTPATPSSAPETATPSETASVKTDITSVTQSITSPASSHAPTPTKVSVAIPAIPIIPAVPIPRSTKQGQKSKDGSAVSPSPSTPTQATSATSSNLPVPNGATPTAVGDGAPQGDRSDTLTTNESEQAQAPSPSAPAPPKLWADLVRVKNAKVVSSNGTVASTNSSVAKVPAVNGKPAGLADLLNSYEVPADADDVAPFLEPRGLINTGNMCFMNSIFQALLFCAPFYLFLDKIGKNVAHSFKNETPLTDAMIMFIREFRIIENRQPSKDKKPGLEPGLAGDPFVPEFVYEVLKGLKRFSSMKRGHQQDAEEFLGFLLDALHEEAVNSMKTNALENGNDALTDGEKSKSNASEQDDSSGWLEVGHKQKVSVTRTIGHVAGESPITKIFGGSLRSELRISGQKNSVTREPYQALQLDIQPQHINNIMDALRHLTTPEALSGGEFKSSRGSAASVTKQIFIETLPPVLILHLKRFQYDNTGGTQKVWKTIGYPLEFEVPKEILSPNRRQQTQATKYRLIGVVYHHGKSAGGGHYTVDVRRQDGWIRFDDTIVKRVGEDAVKVDTPTPTSNRRDNKEEQDENGWEEVSNTLKPTLTNGALSPSTSSAYGKDDKVAYILFFERM